MRAAALNLVVLAAGILAPSARLFAQQPLPPAIGRWAVGPTNVVVSDSTHVYYGNGAYLVVLDASDPDAPKEVTRVILPGFVLGIAVGTDVVYVTDETGLLHTIAVENPDEARLIDSRRLSGRKGRSRAIYAEGRFLYAGRLDGGIEIFDVVVPAHPVLMGATGVPGQINALTRHDTLLYAATSGGGLQIVDVSDPSNPKVAGRYEPDRHSEPIPPGFNANFVQDVAIRGSFLYATAGDEGLLQLDISEDSRPRLTALYETCRDAHSDDCDKAMRLVLHDDMAIVSGGKWDTDLRLFRIGNSMTWPVFTLLDSFSWERGEWEISVSPSEIAVFGNTLYATTSEWWPGLRILNISNPLDVDEVASLDTGGDYMRALAYDDPYLFVAGEAAGLRVLDVTIPTHPDELTFYQPNNWETMISGTQAVALSDDYAYVAGDGLYVVDRSRPDSLVETGRRWYPNVGPNRIDGVRIVGDFVHVNGWMRNLEIYDITVPETPLLVAGISGDTRAEIVAFPIIYLFHGLGMTVWDVTSQTSPVFLHWWSDPTSPYLAAALESGMVYALTADGLRILENLSPEGYDDVAYLPLTSGKSVLDYAKMILSDGALYVGAGNDGLIVIDVTDPQRPFEWARYDCSFFVSDVLVSDDLIFLAGGETGVHILDRDLVHASTSYQSDLDDPYSLNGSPISLSVYPNPVSGTATLELIVKDQGHVSLSIVNVAGEEIVKLQDGYLSSGRHVFSLDNTQFASGVYLMIADHPDLRISERFVVLH